MGRKKKDEATDAKAPLDKTPSATPPPSLSEILKGTPKDDTPSADKLKETIRKQQAEGPRTPLSKKEQKAEKDIAFQADMEKMVHLMADASVQALNGGLQRLDQTYKPIFDLLEKQDGERPSFELTPAEQGLLELTTTMGMAQFSPEFLAKYGFAMLAIGTVASIGFPRFMLCLRLEGVARELKAASAKGQENAQRTTMGKNRGDRVHGVRQDSVDEVSVD